MATLLGGETCIFCSSNFLNKGLALGWLKLNFWKPGNDITYSTFPLLWKGGVLRGKRKVAFEGQSELTPLSCVCEWLLSYFLLCLKQRKLWPEQVACSEKMVEVGWLMSLCCLPAFLLTSHFWPFLQTKTPLGNLMTLIKMINLCNFGTWHSEIWRQPRKREIGQLPSDPQAKGESDKKSMQQSQIEAPLC